MKSKKYLLLDYETMLMLNSRMDHFTLYIFLLQLIYYLIMIFLLGNHVNRPKRKQEYTNENKIKFKNLMPSKIANLWNDESTTKD